MSKKAAIIKGDGIGPELIDNALRVMRAVGTNVEFIICEGGSEWWERHRGDALIPQETWDTMGNTDACFKGPTTTPGGPGSPKSVAVSIRQKFNLYANVRPIKSFPNTKKPLGEVDFVCVREGTEGFYFAKEIQLTADVFIALRKITRPACRDVARYAFDEAVRREWKNIVVIHKSNILKQTDGTFLEEVKKVSENYSGVELEQYHIDDMAQQLIKNPQHFNHKILLSTNHFMDILSEECAALVGSIGLIYSANMGDNYALFEPAHGSAPKYAGLNKVNPVATVLAGAWLLDYLGEHEKSKAIFEATEKVVAEGKYITYDLGGSAKSSEMVDAIIGKIT